MFILPRDGHVCFPGTKDDHGSFSTYECVETLILVAPASCRRIAADRAKTAGKMPALLGFALHRFYLHL
jgi:hypothetical protein